VVRGTGVVVAAVAGYSAPVDEEDDGLKERIAGDQPSRTTG